MRTCIVLMLACAWIVACNHAAATPMRETPLSTDSQIVTSTPINLSLHYVSSQLPVEFDYPDGWTVQEYLGEDHVNVKWVMISNREAFFSDPLNQANPGIFINIITWSKIVNLDEALMTPEPSRLTKTTPDPVKVADTISFFSGWTYGYCVGVRCSIDLDLTQNIMPLERQAAAGYGKIYLCERSQKASSQVNACELDIYGVIVETADPNIYIGVYAKGGSLLQNEDLILEIARTLNYRKPNV